MFCWFGWYFLVGSALNVKEFFWLLLSFAVPISFLLLLLLLWRLHFIAVLCDCCVIVLVSVFFSLWGWCGPLNWTHGHNLLHKLVVTFSVLPSVMRRMTMMGMACRAMRCYDGGDGIQEAKKVWFLRYVFYKMKNNKSEWVVVAGGRGSKYPEAFLFFREKNDGWNCAVEVELQHNRMQGCYFCWRSGKWCPVDDDGEDETTTGLTCYCECGCTTLHRKKSVCWWILQFGM